MAGERFEVKFIKKGANGTAFANNLKKVLNKMSTDGWTITKSEVFPDGYLIVAHKIEIPPFLKQLIDQGMAHVIPMGELEKKAQEQSKVLTPDSKQFLGAAFGLDPNIQDKAIAAKKIPELLPGICRGYATSTLRGIVENLREHNAQHKENHDKDERECGLSAVVDLVVDVTEKYLKDNAC